MHIKTLNTKKREFLFVIGGMVMAFGLIFTLFAAVRSLAAKLDAAYSSTTAGAGNSQSINYEQYEKIIDSAYPAGIPQ